MANNAKKIKDFLSKTNFLVSRSKEQYARNDEINDIVKELLWRDIFVDTVKGYAWYKDKSISLGRWAIGYNYAYVLARVLDEFRPMAVLECGLGQSSKIIADYVATNSNVTYDIVEQNRDWVDFFTKNCCFDSRTEIHVRNVIETDFSGVDGTASTYVYEDFASIVEGKKYALISIDDPWGSKLYFRVYVLERVPEILQNDFVIMVDDFGRVGEQNMVKLLKRKLESNHIPYYEGKYMGISDVDVIASERWRFLTTL